VEDDIVFSRTRRLNKKRKNKRWLIILIGILVVFLLSVISAPLISQMMFSDDKTTEETTDTPVDENTDESAEDNQADDHESDAVTDTDGDNDADDVEEDPNQNGDDTTVDEPTNTPKNPDDYDLTFSESADENVLSSYKADWDAVPTKQTEPHTISFEQDTEDWNEMLDAATLATGIDSDAMQYLWVSGNGPNKVIATFTDRDSQEHFRVYIEWVENEGYTPTQVDLLKEHDQMSRFSTTPGSETDQSDDDNL
jgi:cytoskeletal protein RodZ